MRPPFEENLGNLQRVVRHMHAALAAGVAGFAIRPDYMDAPTGTALHFALAGLHVLDNAAQVSITRQHIFGVFHNNSPSLTFLFNDLTDIDVSTVNMLAGHVADGFHDFCIFFSAGDGISSALSLDAALISMQPEMLIST